MKENKNISKTSSSVKAQNLAPRRKLRKTLLIAAGLFVLVFAAVSLLVTKSIYDKNFGRVDAPKYSGFLRHADVTEYEHTELSFPSGENNLIGYVYGEENNKGLVVLAHGLGGGAESNTALTIALVDMGWRVFTYDCTGSYRSEGSGTKGLPQSALDLDAALDYVESQSLKLPVMLYGHSWGGYAVAAVLDMGHDVNAVVSVAGYASPDALLHEQMQSMMGGFSTFTYPFGWLYQRMLFGANAGRSAIDSINSSAVPVMVIHGSEDEMIRYDGAGIIAGRGEITNPNVVYVTRDMEGQNGHNNLMSSVAALKYIEEKNAEYDEIYDSYGGKIPDGINAEYYADVDKFRASELDSELIDMIDGFYKEHLKA